MFFFKPRIRPAVNITPVFRYNKTKLSILVAADPDPKNLHHLAESGSAIVRGSISEPSLFENIITKK